jgi:hypothetical protein
MITPRGNLLGSRPGGTRIHAGLRRIQRLPSRWDRDSTVSSQSDDCDVAGRGDPAASTPRARTRPWPCPRARITPSASPSRARPRRRASTSGDSSRESRHPTRASRNGADEDSSPSYAGLRRWLLMLKLIVHADEGSASAARQRSAAAPDRGAGWPGAPGGLDVPRCGITRSGTRNRHQSMAAAPWHVKLFLGKSSPMSMPMRF